MKNKWLSAMLTVLAGLLTVAGMLALFENPASAQRVLAPTPRYVSAVTGSDAGNDCTAQDAPCRSIQRAVDQAGGGDEVFIAALDNVTTARYTGTGSVAVVVVDKDIILRGGYTYLHTTLPPIAQWTRGLLPIPTQIDGEGARRALHASGTITVTADWLLLTNGHGDQGGNLYAEDTYLRLTAVGALSGTATHGGGLYLKNCRTDLTLSDADLGALLDVGGAVIAYHNEASYGGGVYVEGGEPTLAALAAYSNTATQDGGGLYVKGGTPVLAGGTLIENAAGNRGGGAYLEQSFARLLGTGIYSNTASEGGGLYLDGPLVTWPVDAPIVANGYVRHNRATEGGGLYLRAAVAGLLNVVVSDNEAGEGAGMALWASSPRVYQATIAANPGGSGLYVTHQPPSATPPFAPVPSLPAFVNTIVASHSVGLRIDDTGFSYPLQNRATLDGTLWWANTTPTAGGGEVVDDHPVNGDPHFTCTGDPPACLQPYHIQDESAAVDAGVTWTEDIPGIDTLVDIDLQTRPSGAGFDIGADEIVSRAYSVWLWPPLRTANVAPGESVTYSHSLVNSGVETDTYDLAIHSEQGWATLLTATPVTLRAQATATVQVRVDVPAGAGDGISDTTAITATSQGDPGVQARALDATVVVSGTLPALPDLAVSKVAARSVITPGESVRYTLRITQTGEVTSTHAVTLVDTLVPTEAIAGWHWPAHCAGALETGTFTCTWTLPANEDPVTRQMDAVITTTATYSGWLSNQAALAGSLPELNLANNLDIALVSVDETPPDRWIYLPVVMRN